MGHQFLCDIKFGIWSEFNEGFTLGRVNTFDLGGLQGENRILTHINLRYRVENLAAGAVSFSVVVLDILHIGIFADMESMNTIVTGFAASFTVDTAAGNDGDIRAVFYIEIVVNNIKTGFGHNNRNMHLFILCFTADSNIDARKVGFLHNSNMAAVTMTDSHTV